VTEEYALANPDTTVAETVEGTPMSPPQPGADEDGFGGDAPAPANPSDGTSSKGAS